MNSAEYEKYLDDPRAFVFPKLKALYRESEDDFVKLEVLKFLYEIGDKGDKN